MEPPARRLVGVFVDDRDAGLARVVPALLVVAAGRRRADRADDGDLRVRGLDGIEDALEAVLEHVVDEILVADAEVFEAERLGMAHRRTLGGPLVDGRVGVAEVDQGEHLVDVRGHVLERDRHRPLTGVLAAHAGGEHRQRLGADRLAQAQVLVIAQSEGLVVAPQVEVVRAMLDRSDRAVPVIHVVDAEPVRDASAGEAHEPGFQVGERLDEVGAEMLEALVGGARLERDEVEVDDAVLGEGESQHAPVRDDRLAGVGVVGVGIRRVGRLTRRTRHVQFRVQLRPLAARRRGGRGRVDRHGGERLAVVSDQRDDDRQAPAVRARPDREIVRLARAERHAVEADVLERGVVGRVARLPDLADLDDRVMRVLVGHGRDVADRERGERALRHDLAPETVVAPSLAVGAIVFERAVLDKLRVEAAVGRVADVLEEHAPQVGADGAFTCLVERRDECVGHVVSPFVLFLGFLIPDSYLSNTTQSTPWDGIVPVMTRSAPSPSMRTSDLAPGASA